MPSATFNALRTSGIGDWVDILTASTFVMSGFGGVTMQGKSLIVGGFQPALTLSTWSDCLFNETIVSGTTPEPDEEDPPFPPIWPYPTGNIYQREHFGVNLVMVRKDDFVFTFTASLNGAAFDLTGATVRFTAKFETFDADSAAIIRLDNAALGGVTITSATLGEGTVEIPASSTASLPNHRTRLYYAMRATTSTTKNKTIRRGYLIVLPNITDP